MKKIKKIGFIAFYIIIWFLFISNLILFSRALIAALNGEFKITTDWLIFIFVAILNLLWIYILRYQFKVLSKLKYLPDFLIQLGVFILTCNVLPTCLRWLPGLRSLTTGVVGDKICASYGGYGEIFGVMFIAIGLNIILRRYLISRK